MKPTLVILAAGLGSRYGSLKQMDSIGPSGERIIDYSAYDAIKAGFGKIVYVIRKSFEEEFEEMFLKNIPLNIETCLAYQEMEVSNVASGNRVKPWGTGHALISASSKINGPFAIINADDFYGAESYRHAFAFLTSSAKKKKSALIGYRLKNTLSENGEVSRGVCEVDKSNYITSIIEKTKISKNDDSIVAKNENDIIESMDENIIVSMNMFAFNDSIIPLFERNFRQFIEMNNYDPDAEFYIPTAVNNMIKDGETRVKVIETKSEWFGLTYAEDKKLAKIRIENMINDGIYPEKLWGSL